MDSLGATVVDLPMMPAEICCWPLLLLLLLLLELVQTRALLKESSSQLELADVLQGPHHVDLVNGVSIC